VQVKKPRGAQLYSATANGSDTSFNGSTQTSTLTFTTGDNGTLSYDNFDQAGQVSSTYVRTQASLQYTTSGDTFTQSDSRSSTLTEGGTYGGGSFTFSGFAQQSQDSFSGTQTVSVVQTSNVTNSDSYADSTGGNSTTGLRPYADNGGDSASDGGSDTFTQSSTETLSRTNQYAGSYNLYQAGCYAQGDYS
jgi:hypothetical protein